MIRLGRMLVSGRGILVLGGLCAALGPAGREARASFLVDVTASLNAPTTDSGSITVGQGTLTLAAISEAPTAVDPTSTSAVRAIYGATQVSSGNITGTDSFNVPYTWTLTFSHYVGGHAQGAPATLLVSGDVSGSLSASGTSLTNVFTAGPVTSPVSISVDGQTFYVKLDPWAAPGAPFAEALDFGLTMAGSGGTFHPTPEPATVALMGVGLGALAVAPRLRRRSKSAA